MKCFPPHGGLITACSICCMCVLRCVYGMRMDADAHPKRGHDASLFLPVDDIRARENNIPLACNIVPLLYSHHSPNRHCVPGQRGITRYTRYQVSTFASFSVTKGVRPSGVFLWYVRFLRGWSSSACLLYTSPSPRD